ncbi:alpha-amylase family glycosyl hydrolase [Runella sp.]|uniref:alpha-amylase family glycosyl hydrolase n=1 Tax=Runella sp. TaxID=1960881 RepID=UPI003D0DD8D0
MFTFPRICYEIFVRSFCDSNGDNIGDLNGITSKLNYLQSLGVEAIWLTPIFPSPSYHKYDVVDYYAIDPEYGTLDDFKRLISEAHARGIAVIMDLVINHTSANHVWFQESVKGQDNPYRQFYNWKSPKEIETLGIATREITPDTWDRNPWHHWLHNSEKYYGLFWKGMPDLNCDYPPVRQAIYEIGRYWLQMGVDGFRLDAARHIYPEWEEYKNYDFWVEFRTEMQKANPNVYLVGEVWSSAEKIAPYFQGLTANFNFDLSLAIQKVTVEEQDTIQLAATLAKNRAIFYQTNPRFIDAIMLTNHDQTRIGSVLDSSLNRLKVAANLLLTLPGQPYMYYGEEIGMLGIKPDEFVREPFLWDYRQKDRRRARWMKPKYSKSKNVTPLAGQVNDPTSLFNHYKQLIALRKSHPALADIHGDIVPLDNDNKRIVAFIRKSNGQSVWVIHNLSGETVNFNTVDLPKKLLLSTRQETNFSSPTQLILAPYSCAILEN